MKYHFRVHTDRESGYWARGIELSGCLSQGETREELRVNLEEALNLYLSEPEDSKVMFPAPKKRVALSKLVWAIDVDAKVAFAMTLRNLRLRKKMTQAQMKARLGIKHLSDYQRLEDPARANPGLVTLKKIKTAFPSLKIDDILAA